MELRLGSTSVDAHEIPAAERQAATERRWNDWTTSLKLPATARDAVLRSALTLRGLWYEPSGGFMAAATSSLPEELGGIRNWDYRYCWPRDAALSARALVDLGSYEEAESLLGWTLRVVENTGGHPERLHPLYDLDGNELGPEAVIETLPGYAGSRPVRVGNAANRQVQLDVFGPVADLIFALGAIRPPSASDLTLLMATWSRRSSRRWHEPDHGLWEAPLPAAALRVLEGHVLADRRPGDPAARAARPAGARGVAGAARPRSPPTCWSTAGTTRPAATPSPTATRNRTPPRCGSACPACCRRTTRGSWPPCSRSRPTCAAAPPSTATAGTTGCRAARAASTCARRG